MGPFHWKILVRPASVLFHGCFITFHVCYYSAMKFNESTVEISAWVSNYIPHKTVCALIHSCPYLNLAIPLGTKIVYHMIYAFFCLPHFVLGKFPIVNSLIQSIQFYTNITMLFHNKTGLSSIFNGDCWFPSCMPSPLGNVSGPNLFNS